VRQIGDAAGLGGLGLLEPARAAAGPDRTRWGGSLDTIGSIGRDSGGGNPYGRQVGLSPAPAAMTPSRSWGGQRDGSLDKEIIRASSTAHE